MAHVKFHKYVAALPAQLDPDAIYYVRAGAGFDMYVTNGSGEISAYPLNRATPMAVPSFLSNGALLRLPLTPNNSLPVASAGGPTLSIPVILNG